MKTRNGLFADVPENLWNDWHWQVANRAETVEDLKKYMTLTPDEEAGVAKTLGKLRMAVTPYYLSLIDLDDPFDPIRKMAIPRAEELEYADYEDADPLHEDTDSPTPGLTHRYPDRVLLLITDQCSMYCRHCTRRRFAGQNDCEVPMAQIDKCIDYVAAHPEVRDVLLSGGDCLMVDDENLEYIIKRAARHSPCGDRPSGLPHPRGVPPAYHSRAVRHAEEVSSRLAEHPLQHPQGVHSRGCQGLRYAG